MAAAEVALVGNQVLMVLLVQLLVAAVVVEEAVLRQPLVK
jgi:hypothetical protein